MIGILARLGHNLLLAGMAFVTIALVLKTI
jgi:hypothetical protein